MSIGNITKLDQYSLGSRIGQGAFGEVFKIKETKTYTDLAAKISQVSIFPNSDSMEKLLEEVDILSKVNHASIVKFVGFSPVNFHNEPKPVIITEFVPKGSLYDILDLERRGRAIKEWNDTQKLIVLYGIASGMSFLHSHNIIHRDLKPANILLDKSYYPKICDFGLSKNIDRNKQSTISVKGTPVYISPEIWTDQKYTFACDVYAFAIVTYEIIVGAEPWSKLNETTIARNVAKGSRPYIPDYVNSSYRNLITSCWKQNPNERPTFDDILGSLKTDKGFITDLTIENVFKEFFEYIDSFPASFNETSKCIKHKKHPSLTTISMVIKPRAETINIPNHKMINKEDTIRKRRKKKSVNKTLINSKEKKLTFPLHEFNKLNNECQNIVREAEENKEKMFTIGQYLIEGLHGFNKNIEIGIMYLNESIHLGCTDAAIYYSKILIDGDLIDPDLDKASSLLRLHGKEKSGNVMVLKGRIFKKEKEYLKAFEFFEKASNLGNTESMYQLGKMLFKGKGCITNKREAKKWLERSKNNGFIKSEKFLSDNFGANETVNKSSTTIIEKVKRTNDDYKKSKIAKSTISVPYKNDKKRSTAARYKNVGTEVTKSDISTIKLKRNVIVENEDSCSYIEYSDEDISLEISITEDPSDMLFETSEISMNCGKSIDKIKMDADNGYLSAIVKYAEIQYYGIDVPVNKKEAADYFKIAAEKGDMKAMKYFACMLYNGEGTHINKNKAAFYYKKVADNWDHEAMEKYAHMLYKGDGIIMNKERAAEYYRKASNNGNINAKNCYADMLYNGDGIGMDKGLASIYYKEAAERGHVEAMNSYAGMLYNGDGIWMNKSDAAIYYKKAAEKGHIDAMNCYANMLYKGDGIERNKKKSYYYFKRAAQKGDENAKMHLSIYFNE